MSLSTVAWVEGGVAWMFLLLVVMFGCVILLTHGVIMFWVGLLGLGARWWSICIVLMLGVGGSWRP